MLSKKLRVSKQLFRETFKKGRTLSSRYLLLKIHKEKESFPSKFSFSASKSVAKKATDRNLLKRRGYSIIRKSLKRIKKSYICAFSFKKGSEKLSFKALEAEINSLLEKSGILDF